MFTAAAAETAVGMSIGKTIRECLLINESTILAKLPNIPEDHRHCALLAAMTFQKALSKCIKTVKERVPERRRNV
jgi:NifU-like protein involved in Fe-S cluster formation